MRTRKPYEAICFLSSLCLFPLIFLSCGPYEGSPCEAYSCNPQYDLDGKQYGRVLFKDSNDVWFIDSIADTSAQFDNGGGFVFHYTIHKSKDDDKTTLRKYGVKRDQCCPEDYFNDYFLKQAETVFYTPRNGGFGCFLKRRLDVNAQLDANDSLVVNSKAEALVLMFNYKYYVINPDSTFQSPEQTFHQNINLRGKVHKSVFEIIDTRVDNNKILVKGHYVSLKEGIVGFYMTNGELWLKN